MGPRDGYFQLYLNEGKGTYIRIFPPKDGGKQVKVSEIIDYLKRRNYEDVNQIKLGKALKGMPNDAFQLKVSDEIAAPVDECLLIFSSADKMQVTGRFYPPSNGGKRLSMEDIMNELLQGKITKGIVEETIKGFINNPEYCKDFIFARGERPRQGIDAEIEYFFDVDINRKPKHNDDGSVDFHSLDMINHVEKGMVIARLNKEVPSIPGYNVLGEVINGRDVITKKLSSGINCSLSEDETELIADVTGHVSLTGDKIFVADVFEVPANVDASTGDINYDGNVIIKGNVISGFKVETTGDIIVEGVVEGAVLIAKGQIILKRGINGMGRGSLYSEGNIISKFIENCTVQSVGYIQTESILHSHVTSRTEINVQGRKGFVTGGSVKASKIVEAKLIGSEMGAETVVEVGIDPQKRKEYHQVQELIKKLENEIQKIRPSILDFSKRMRLGEKMPIDKIHAMKRLSIKYKDLSDKLITETAHLELLERELDEDSEAEIRVGQAIFPGVKVVIGEEKLFIKETMKTCKLVNEYGEIKSKPYN